MAVGIPSTNPIYPSSTEGLIFKSKAGAPLLISGTKYIQYGASTAIASSTAEASLFAGVTASFGSLQFGATELTNDWNLPNTAGAGAFYRLKMGGVIGNTTTPNLTFRLTMTNAAGTVSTLTTSGVTATVAITAGGIWEMEAMIAVTAYNATTGSIYTVGKFQYFTNLLVPNQIILPATTLSSIDTTSLFTLDAKATWGTSSSSNTINSTWATLECLN